MMEQVTEQGMEQAESVGAAGPDPLVLAGRHFRSRLLMGSAGYPNLQLMLDALEAGGAELVTAAMRRMDPTGGREDPSRRILASGRLLVPNTSGCHTARDAVLTAQLAREALEVDWIKLEVIGDAETLYPDCVELLEAARALVADGFHVLPYCSDDLVVCRRLADLGCAAVMPLASLIGSGNGLVNPRQFELIRRQIEIPVIVDAGIGTPSHAARAMELGADAVLLNTAVSRAREPVRMAQAMRLAVEAGRHGYRAGCIPQLDHAEPSSPLAGLLGG